MAQEAKDYETDFYRTRMTYFTENPLKANQVVFLGNSLTQGGKWEQYFPAQDIANRGIIGDNTHGMLARLEEILLAKPTKLFILTGVNDISQDYKTKHIRNNIKTIIREFKEKSPETTIYLQSLLPINNDFNRYKKLIGKEKQILCLNKQLKRLSKTQKVQFINLYPLFLDKNGKLNESYTSDGLHLKEAAYDIWVQAIATYVEN